MPQPVTGLLVLLLSSSSACKRCSAAALAGQIGYALAPQVARGAMLGPDQPVILHLLDIPPAAQSLEGVKMELIDAALPLLAGAGSGY